MVSDRAHVIMPYHTTLDSALSNHQGELLLTAHEEVLLLFMLIKCSVMVYE